MKCHTKPFGAAAASSSGAAAGPLWAGHGDLPGLTDARESETHLKMRSVSPWPARLHVPLFDKVPE